MFQLDRRLLWPVQACLAVAVVRLREDQTGGFATLVGVARRDFQGQTDSHISFRLPSLLLIPPVPGLHAFFFLFPPGPSGAVLAPGHQLHTFRACWLVGSPVSLLTSDPPPPCIFGAVPAVSLIEIN